MCSTLLSSATATTVKNSIEVYNDKPITGDVFALTSDELRTRTIDHFAAQSRAVTNQDYKSVIYSMPAKYGSIKRCQIVRDEDSFKRNLNVYILSENADGKLTKANNSLNFILILCLSVVTTVIE